MHSMNILVCSSVEVLVTVLDFTLRVQIFYGPCHAFLSLWHRSLELSHVLNTDITLPVKIKFIF